jgi:polar amino acid transport system substrate-binding protein
MSESGEQATAIVGNMLDFVRRDNTAVSSQNMVTLVERSLELAATDYDMKTYLYFDKIAVIREFDGDLPLVPCSGSRIQQVILNILRNGAEAMVIPRQGPPEGSRFIIRLKKSDSRIRLEIEDNGPGMDEEVSKRIFEPFYTTKGIGQGTGLGLSVAYFIITENHNGAFRVESTPGKGTNFIIELPMAEEEN